MLAKPPIGRRTAIVTGGNSGLGYACARTLLEADLGDPWHVVLACRDPARAQDAVARLRAHAAEHGSSARVVAMTVDLSSFASIRAFADDIGRRLDAGELPALHAVVCNAGVQAGAEKTFTADGIETTFGVNHLGHFLLVNLLLAQLSTPARVVVVASGVHDPAQKTGMPDAAWNDPLTLAKGELGASGAKDNPTKAGRRRYATSKLANVLFSYDLARRLPDGVTVNAFDPGLMPGTGLIREAIAPLRWLWHHVLPRLLPLLRRIVSANVHTPAESGAALAHLLLDPGMAGVSGKYFEGKREVRSSVESYDPARAAELWQASSALTGLS